MGLSARYIGILPENRISYIDHLVPLCQLLGIPVLVTDPMVSALIERFYPPMEILCVQPEDRVLDPFLEGYDGVVYVDFFRRGHGGFLFGEYLLRRPLASLFCFHGHSDKNWEIFWAERLVDEPHVLVYGEQTCAWLAEKRIPVRPFRVGNYRLAFWKQHAAFFAERCRLPQTHPLLLYAPTWSGPNQKSALSLYHSSVQEAYRFVCEGIPSGYQLVVKLHPHFVLLCPQEAERMRRLYPHILFLEAWPPIYPLLSQISLYIGDYSSMGYDFLYFDRPLFLLDVPVSTPLASCSRVIPREEWSQLATWLTAPDTLSHARQEVYQKAYGCEKDYRQAQQELQAIADAARYSTDR